MTPNIGLTPLTSRRSVGIDAALDLGDAFVVTVNHAGDRDRAAYDDGRMPALLHPVSGGADRDRTGGLLVANQALSPLSYSPLKLLLAKPALRFSRALEASSRISGGPG